MTPPEERLLEGVAEPADLLVYDYFKHLTTLALVALGGVLAIVQDVPQVPRTALFAIVLLIGGGGALAYSGLDLVVRGRITGRRRERMLHFYQRAATAAFGLGLGMFLTLFLKVF